MKTFSIREADEVFPKLYQPLTRARCIVDDWWGVRSLFFLLFFIFFFLRGCLRCIRFNLWISRWEVWVFLLFLLLPRFVLLLGILASRYGYWKNKNYILNINNTNSFDLNIDITKLLHTGILFRRCHFGVLIPSMLPLWNFRKDWFGFGREPCFLYTRL